jgi:predicted solute-binding protein
MNTLEQGQLVKWVNSENKEIVWMVTENVDSGVVIHSDNLMKVGTVSDLSKMNELQSFIGTVHIESKGN